MSNNTNHTPRLTITNNSISQHNYPNTTTTATIPIIHSTIDEFREIVREQSFIIPNNSTSEVPIKKYPPLPDITVFNTNNIFRTETILTPPKHIQTKRQICNHFGSTTQRGHLPSINKRHNLATMSNVMDLNEDLPQCNFNSTNRAATYTSPGDRIISPIKRPSAPSPPTSAQIKRINQNAFNDNDDDDVEQNDDYLYDEDSQLFDEHFAHYQQPIIMSHHRIDHYNHNTRHPSTIERHPTIIINDGNDDFAHPLDFEP